MPWSHMCKYAKLLMNYLYFSLSFGSYVQNRQTLEISVTRSEYCTKYRHNTTIDIMTLDVGFFLLDLTEDLLRQMMKPCCDCFHMLRSVSYGRAADALYFGLHFTVKRKFSYFVLSLVLPFGRGGDHSNKNACYQVSKKGFRLAVALSLNDVISSDKNQLLLWVCPLAPNDFLM